MTATEAVGLIAITGGHGFLGWHTAVRLRAEYQTESIALGRASFADPTTLRDELQDVGTIIHLAGVNRAESDQSVEQGNIQIGRTLAEAIRLGGRPVHVVYGNSIQSVLDNAYGRGKSRAADLVRDAVKAVGGTFVDVRLPNLFGEHGLPAYNSFVATFCHEIANGREPLVTGDKSVPLMHVQDAAEVLISSARDRDFCVLTPEGEDHEVSAVLRQLLDFHEKYTAGQIPTMPDKFSVDLFNTYRSYMFPQHFPFKAEVHADQRGQLFEAVRAHGGTGQTFVSTTAPRMTRGDHFHLSKIERFFVIRGEAEIALRRVYDDEVIRFRISGGDHSFVDMPTMWVHNITNVGEGELITLFWAEQLLNPCSPDTYWEPVDEPTKKAAQ